MIYFQIHFIIACVFSYLNLPTTPVRQKEKKEIERRNFIANGGNIFTNRTNSRPITSIFKTRKLHDVTKRGLCLPTLSKLSPVHSESEKTDVLLQNDESGKLDELAKISNELPVNSFVNRLWSKINLVFVPLFFLLFSWITFYF